MIDLAYAMGPSPQSGGGPASMLIQLVPIVLVLGIFFFLVIRPQQRERRRREQMLAALKKGDRVVTSGGLIGTDRQRHGPAGDPEARGLRPRGVSPERHHGARVRGQAPTRTRPDGSRSCRAISGFASPSSLAVIVGSLVLIAPRDWRGQPRQPINLGLDLQGGIHLVLGVDLEKGIENVLDRMAGDLRAALQKKGIGAQVTRQGRSRGSRSSWPLRRRTQEAQQALAGFVEFDTRSQDPAAGRIELALKEKVITERRNSFVDQGLKVIRNRVDQFGVAEPTIQKQGENRILVQLPGVQDPARAKALIGKTAVLEFKLARRSGGRGPRHPGRAAAGRRDSLRAARGPDHEGRDAGPLRGQEGGPADRRCHLGRHRPGLGRGRAVRLRVVRQRRRAPLRRGDREERRARRWPSSSTATSTPRR